MSQSKTAPQNAQRLAELAQQPVTTDLNATHYEWAGTTLQRLFGAERRISETWAFFSGPAQPARITGGGVTMETLVTARPEVLGPAGADPEHHGQKYFFVKFLDPSDFPRFAYVGFNPDAVSRLGKPLKPHVAELLWQDRQAVESLAELIRPQVRSRHAFEPFKAAYKRWAIAQAQADWAKDARIDLAPFVAPARRAAADALITRQLAVRRELVGLLHRIDFQEDQVILVETPTLHAIAGLSLQIHPKAKDNFHPKDECWIYRELPFLDGTTGWILVEPQRTFDRTESGADFFTPFTWDDASGRLSFRKPITKAFLDTFVSLMDATPLPKAHYLRTAQPIHIPRGSTRGTAHWRRLVEEPAWPYFLARELRVESAGGDSTTPLEHHSFIELHATLGEIEVTLSAVRGSEHRFTVTPAHPVFLPASLPYETITYRARGVACLQFFSRSAGIA